LDEDDEEMPLNEAIYAEDPILEGPQVVLQEPKMPQFENVHGDNTLSAPILNTTEATTPKKDPTPVKGTMRKCSTLQPVTLHSHQFLFNTSIVYKNAAGELEIASPPELRPAINILDDQLTRVSLSPQRESLDDEFFVAGTPEDKIPRAATVETYYPVAAVPPYTFISPLAASPQVRVSTISPILETPDVQKHEATPPYTSRLRPPLPPGRYLEVASTSKQADETPGDAPYIPELLPVTRPSSDCVVIAERKADLSYVASQSPPKPKALNFDEFEVGPSERPHMDRRNDIIPSREKLQSQQTSHVEPQRRGHKVTPTSCNERSPGIPPTPRDMLPVKTPSTGQRPRRKFKRLRKARDLVRTTQQEQISNKKQQMGGSNQPKDAHIPISKHTRLGMYQSFNFLLCFPH